MAAALNTEVSAGDLKITPSLLVEDNVTDNARNAPHGQEQADFFSRVAPGVSMIGTGRRLNFNLNYSFNAQSYVDNSDLNRANHALSATGTLEVIQEMLFFDVRSSISEAIINSAGPLSTDIQTTNPSNRTTLTTYSFAPYLRNHLGGFASTELRYTFAGTESGALSSSTSNRISGNMKSGDDFRTFGWNLSADASHADRSGTSATAVGGTLAPGQPSTSDTRTFDADGEYRFTYAWAMVGGLGYQDTRDTTLPKPLVGPTGSAGVRWTPSPRTTAELRVTHRNESTYPTFDLKYKISDRTSIHASYTEGLLTSEGQRSQNLDFFTVDQFGNFVDSRTAQAFQLNNNSFNLNNNTVRRKTASFQFNTQNDRNNIGTDFSQTRSLTEATGIEQTVTSLSANWNRTLSTEDSLATTARFAVTNFGLTPNRIDHTENLSISYSHTFSPTLSGVVRYSGIFRQSSPPTAAGVSGDLIDNVFTIGLSKRF